MHLCLFFFWGGGGGWGVKWNVQWPMAAIIVAESSLCVLCHFTPASSNFNDSIHDSPPAQCRSIKDSFVAFWLNKYVCAHCRSRILPKAIFFSALLVLVVNMLSFLIVQSNSFTSSLSLSWHYLNCCFLLSLSPGGRLWDFWREVQNETPTDRRLGPISGSSVR